MANDSKEARARAETRFKMQQKASQEGEKARAEHEAQARAVGEKTSRLKALRLAKEAADMESEAAKKPAPSGKKRAS